MSQFGPTPGKVLPKLFRTSEVRTSYVTALVYAQSRFGKTNMIRTLVEQGFKPGIIATEQGDAMGLRTIADLDVPVIPIRTWDEAQLVFAELKKSAKPGSVKYGGEEMDVIVNDSLSGFGYVWMRRGLEVMGRDEVGVATPGWDPRRMYAYIPEKGRQTTDALMDLPVHLILICRDTQAEEGEGAARITFPVPELPGAKLPRELPGWLDCVLYGKIINGNRVFLTEAEGKIIAGVREIPGKRFPRYIKADYGLFIKAYMGDEAAYAELCNVSLKNSSGKPPALSNSKSTT